MAQHRVRGFDRLSLQEQMPEAFGPVTPEELEQGMAVAGTTGPLSALRQVSTSTIRELLINAVRRLAGQQKSTGLRAAQPYGHRLLARTSDVVDPDWLVPQMDRANAFGRLVRGSSDDAVDIGSLLHEGLLHMGRN